jgi:AcrR family transcriptional regulator
MSSREGNGLEGSEMVRARRLEPEARREQILDAAVACIAEQGFGATTRELARRAGVTQALLYQYFASKQALTEAVYERIFLGRLDPQWMRDIRDRTIPMEQRLTRFYARYTHAIFTYEWMRIFMWSGLAGEGLNRRYLGTVEARLLRPLAEEITAEGRYGAPDMEAMWALHGGIVYIGIRRFIYDLTTPDDDAPVVAASVARFLDGLRAGACRQRGRGRSCRSSTRGSAPR